jgi:four helix bundle protein
LGRVENFEELIAWQKARHLTKRIYEVSRQGALARDFGLSSQMQRASVSIMANIAEGSERGSKEFHQFLVTAKASAAEVRSHLFVALDIEYIERQTFDELNSLSAEVERIIGALRASIARKIERP